MLQAPFFYLSPSPYVLYVRELVKKVWVHSFQFFWFKKETFLNKIRLARFHFYSPQLVFSSESLDFSKSDFKTKWHSLLTTHCSSVVYLRTVLLGFASLPPFNEATINQSLCQQISCIYETVSKKLSFRGWRNLLEDGWRGRRVTLSS